ncbi:hypothetical protein [Sphingomonas sp. PP-CE-1G-424]|uniref:hypothetical protein n=1 Tax=Sphingomonas sp. PP-CE-1G-424 TaxID=2135658 RepID=UPI001055AD1D|nr:hypothetical protein [Sphingomonas sp. PP-CE-1G-424]TCP65810.1 hypothetical protein C8J43_10811 [Sphingomonas sp. PP-CE-1G-424]
MAAWHRDWRTDLGLRGAGVILCAVAYLAIAQLLALCLSSRGGEILAHGSVVYGPATFALAAVGFLGTSAGSVLVLCGTHIFDEIVISARWRVSRMPHDRAGELRNSDQVYENLV